MDRRERTNAKMQELFHTPAAGEEGTDPEFMQILQGYIFGDVCYTGSLDDRMRELVTITVLTTIQALPQLKAHLGACLNVGCTPVELREAVYQCAPFIGFSEERYEKGLAIQEPVYGTEIKERYTWLPGEFAEAVPRFLTELGFGDFNTRTGMDAKTRELLTVIILASMGGAEVQVRSHVYGALKVGSSREEVVCALVHAGAYMGIPRLFNALNACKDLLQ